MKPWKNSLVFRLVAGYFVLSVITVSLVSGVSFILSRQVLKESILDQAEAVSGYMHDDILEWLDTQKRKANFLATEADILAAARTVAGVAPTAHLPEELHENLSYRLNRLAQSDPDFKEVFILAPVGGRVMASSCSKNEGQYRATYNYFIKGRDRPYLEGVYPAPEDLSPTMTLAVPIRDHLGQPLAVLATHLNLERLDRIIRTRAKLHSGGAAYLVDKHHVLLSGEEYSRDLRSRGVHTTAIDQALAHRQGSGLYTDPSGIPVIGAYKWIDECELALLVEARQEEAFAPAGRLGWAIFLCGTVFTALMALGMYWLSLHIAKPILSIADAASGLADGDLSRRAEVLTGDEVGVMAGSFNRMADTISELFGKVKRQKQRFLSLIENAFDIIAVMDERGSLTYASPSMANSLGCREDELEGRSFPDLVHPEDQQAARAFLDKVKQSANQAINVDLRLKDASGEWSFFELRGSNMLETPAVGGIVINAWDVTSRMKTELALRESERRYALAVQGSGQGLWDWNLDSGTVFYSRRFMALLGNPPEELAAGIEEWFERIHPDDKERVQTQLFKHLQGDVPAFTSEHRLRMPDGSYRWFLAQGKAVPDSQDKVTRISGSIGDVTPRKVVEEQLLNSAYRDPLTGLPNRRYIEEKIEQRLASADNSRHDRFAVMFIDLDGFKNVNDAMGHHVGDVLLQEVAKRISATMRGGDVLARLGGDEFLVLVEGALGRLQLEGVAKRIIKEVSSPFRIDGHELLISSSIGIALASGQYAKVSDLIRDADTAMYRAKSQGRARYFMVDHIMSDPDGTIRH